MGSPVLEAQARRQFLKQRAPSFGPIPLRTSFWTLEDSRPQRVYAGCEPALGQGAARGLNVKRKGCFCAAQR